MIKTLRLSAPLVLILALSACSLIPNPFPRVDRTPVPDDTGNVEVEPEPGAEIKPTETTATAETLDTASSEDVAAATNVEAPVNGFLGETVASLGDPTKPGFWLMTPLVSREQEGRIEREGGAVAQVTLIPLEGEAGAGSQISLSAMRALNIPLTDLVPLKVYAD